MISSLLKLQPFGLLQRSFASQLYIYLVIGEEYCIHCYYLYDFHNIPGFSDFEDAVKGNLPSYEAVCNHQCADVLSDELYFENGAE
jgi:hypothetical protein